MVYTDDLDGCSILVVEDEALAAITSPPSLKWQAAG